MDKIAQLNVKIETMQMYLSTSKQLAEIVQDQPVRQAMTEVVFGLQDLCTGYQEELELRLKSEQLTQETLQGREDMLVYARAVGKEDYALTLLAKGSDPEHEVIKSLNKARGYAGLALIALATSNEPDAKAYTRLAQIYLGIHSNQETTVRLNRSTRAQEQDNLRKMHVLEMREGHYAETLRSEGFSEGNIENVLDEPELLICAMIDAVKEKYAPWL